MIYEKQTPKTQKLAIKLIVLVNSFCYILGSDMGVTIKTDALKECRDQFEKYRLMSIKLGHSDTNIEQLATVSKIVEFAYTCYHKPFLPN